MMRMDATDSLEPSTAPLQLSHTVRWILCSSNTVAPVSISIPGSL